MRELIDVVEAILPIIPESESRFRAQWKDLISSVSYAPPEAIAALWWKEGALILNENFPEVSTEPWQRQIEDIWFDKVKVTPR